MPQQETSETLFTLRGRVRDFRRGISETLVDGFINDRIKQASDYRSYWSALIVKGTLSIPDAYTAGTVSVTTGSNIVTGVGTAWPTSDVFNGTIPAGIVELGYQEFSPNITAGINQDSILYVDAGSGVAEAVPVVQLVNPFVFSGQFTQLHAPGVTAQQSSLANRQFRINIGSPIFTILAVIDPTHLLLDQPWGAGPLTAQTYQIWKMYYSFAPSVQEVFYVLDQQQGLPLEINTPTRAINAIDPQRLSAGPPTNVVDAQPSPCGVIQYEIWPSQITAYQIQYSVYTLWPRLVNDMDRAPSFINSALWYYGALADALRYRAGANDPYFNPKLADSYEQRFLQGLQMASNQDEHKCLRELSGMNTRLRFPGGNFALSHDVDVFEGWY